MRKPKQKEPAVQDKELAFQPYQFAYDHFGRLPSTLQRLGEVSSRPDEFHTAAVIAFRRSYDEVRQILLDNQEDA